MEVKEYELIDSEGCLHDTTRAISFRKAREYFSGKHEGKYIILCEEERKNVILK